MKSLSLSLKDMQAALSPEVVAALRSIPDNHLDVALTTLIGKFTPDELPGLMAASNTFVSFIQSNAGAKRQPSVKIKDLVGKKYGYKTPRRR